MVRTQHRYTDTTRAEVLTELKAGAKVRNLSTKFGIPRSTIQDWQRTPEIVPVDVREDFERQQGISLRTTMRYIAQEFSDPELIKAFVKKSPRDAAVTYGIFFDKVQLLEGRPTAIHESPWGQLLGEIRDLRGGGTLQLIKGGKVADAQA